MLYETVSDHMLNSVVNVCYTSLSGEEMSLDLSLSMVDQPLMICSGPSLVLASAPPTQQL